MLARYVHYHRRANCSFIDDVSDRDHNDATGVDLVRNHIPDGAREFYGSRKCRKRLHACGIQGKFRSGCGEPASEQAG
jgi:hypothetical protein